MKTKTIILAGIAAGIFWIAADFIGHGIIIGEDYAELGNQGIINKDPSFPFMPFLLIANLLLCIGISWVQAAIRPALGFNIMTSLKLGVMVFLILIPANLSMMAWQKYPGHIFMASFIIAFIQSIGAAVITGLFHKE